MNTIKILLLICVASFSAHAMEQENNDQQTPEQFVMNLIEQGADAFESEDKWLAYLQSFPAIDENTQEALLAPVISNLFFEQTPFTKTPLGSHVQKINHTTDNPIPFFPLKDDNRTAAIVADDHIMVIKNKGSTIQTKQYYNKPEDKRPMHLACWDNTKSPHSYSLIYNNVDGNLNALEQTSKEQSTVSDTSRFFIPLNNQSHIQVITNNTTKRRMFVHPRLQDYLIIKELDPLHDPQCISNDRQMVAGYKAGSFLNNHNKLYITHVQPNNQEIIEPISLEKAYRGYYKPTYLRFSDNNKYLALGGLSRGGKPVAILYNFLTKKFIHLKCTKKTFCDNDFYYQLIQMDISNNGIISFLYKTQQKEVVERDWEDSDEITVDNLFVREARSGLRESYFKTLFRFKQYCMHTGRTITTLNVPDNYLAHGVDKDTGAPTIVLKDQKTDKAHVFKKKLLRPSTFALAAFTLGMLRKKAKSIDDIPLHAHSLEAEEYWRNEILPLLEAEKIDGYLNYSMLLTPHHVIRPSLIARRRVI